MKFYVPLLLVVFTLPTPLTMAQDNSVYKKEVFEKGGDGLPYRILLPKDFDPTKRYPLLLFLHGSGERGNDNAAQLVHGGDLFLNDGVRENHPAIVVFPQSAANSSWARVDVAGDAPDSEFIFYTDSEPTKDMLLVEGLIKYLEKTYKITKNQIYVGGLSMGGMGTFELVRRNPRMFAAAFPICGGANPNIGKELGKLDWWVFHGALDKVVPENYSADIVKAMRSEGINVKYTVYDGVGHDSWDNVFAEPGLLPWLFSKSQ